MENLCESLIKYSHSDFYPYHMPGHKRQPLGSYFDSALSIDITEIDGFDNLHNAQGLIKESQIRVSKLYGSEETFYLVNGSTCGILSAISASVRVGGHILLARNSHKSAYHSVYLRKLKVSYLYPCYDAENIAFGITLNQVKEAIEKENTIEAVFLTSPTYEGRISQIKEIADYLHKKKIPLIVDEAHGAHLGFHQRWAENSNQKGADLVIHSVHKTLPSMTQTALLHVNGDIINRDKLRRFLRIYQSSSPSYLLMSSIEKALEFVEKNGSYLFQKFSEYWDEMVENLQNCSKIKILPTDDIGKLIISVKGTNLSGQDLYDILLNQYHLQLEMSASTYVLAMFTISDQKEAYERMTKALKEIDANLHCIEENNIIFGSKIRTDSIPLSDAWDETGETILLSDSSGRIAIDFINLYPPGVPLLVPGEVITEDDITTINDWNNKKLPIQGIFKENDQIKIKVIKK